MSPPAVTPPVTRTRPSAKVIAPAFARAMDIAAADVTDPLDKISAVETAPAGPAPPTMSIRPSGNRVAATPARPATVNSAGVPGAAIIIHVEGIANASAPRMNKPVLDLIESLPCLRNDGTH